MISKAKQEKLKKDFQQEDKLLEKIQSSLDKAYENGKNAPDFIEEAKKQGSKDKKVLK